MNWFLKSIEGTIGNFAVTVMSNDKGVVLNVSQIVWFNEKQNKKRTSIYDGSLIETDDLIQTLKSNINSFSYKNLQHIIQIFVNITKEN